jgi:hypothetical protein
VLSELILDTFLCSRNINCHQLKRLNFAVGNSKLVANTGSRHRL